MFKIKPSARAVKVPSIINPHKDSNLIMAVFHGKQGKITRNINRNEIDSFKFMFGEDNCTFRVIQ